jgi:hypothetical protein
MYGHKTSYKEQWKTAAQAHFFIKQGKSFTGNKDKLLSVVMMPLPVAPRMKLLAWASHNNRHG